MDDNSFHHVIRRHPDEDTFRLIYADFLEESGDPHRIDRGEFIRLQCALEQITPKQPEFELLYRRERTLLGKNWHHWLRPICQALAEPMPVPPTSSRPALYELQWRLDCPRGHFCTQGKPDLLGNPAYFMMGTFRRGFMDEVYLFAKPYRPPFHLTRLMEKNPITSLRLHFFDDARLAPLLDDHLLAQIRHLSLWHSRGVMVRNIFNSPMSALLKSVELYGDIGPDDPAITIANAPHLKQLERLVLATHNVGSNALHALFQSPVLKTVQTLELYGDLLRTSVLRSICNSENLDKLEKLRFPNCRISPEGRAMLVESFGSRVQFPPDF